MKKLLIASILLMGSSVMAQLPEGSMCISPKRLSVAQGSKNSVYIDRGAGAEAELWESGYSDNYSAGLFDGIFMSARVAKRFIILNPIELHKVSGNYDFQNQEIQNRIVNAVKIDLDRECEALGHNLK